MKIRIYHSITKTHLVWATYQVMCRSNNVTKGTVKKYLKEQIELFGSHETSLFGENFPEVQVMYDCSVEWVEKKFKGEL